MNDQGEGNVTISMDTNVTNAEEDEDVPMLVEVAPINPEEADDKDDDIKETE
jgi:hypothetical protein